MDLHEHEISRKPNDGSRDDMQGNGYDEHGYEFDERGENRTTYWDKDIDQHVSDPRHANHLRRALKWQEGQYVTSENAKSRGTQNHEEDKRRLVDTIGGQLEIGTLQKDRVEHLVLDVISVNSFGHYSMEQVILAVINVVARENNRWIEDETQFRRYMSQVGITNDEGRADLETMKRLRRLVRDRVPSKSV